MLDKAKQVLQEKSLEMLLVGLAGALGYLLAIAWTEISVPFVQKVLPEISNRALLAVVLILLLLLLIALAAVIIISRGLNSKLTPGFGVLWDTKRNPYCPSCKNLLTNYGNYGGGDLPHWGFYCTCKETIYLRTDDGNTISLQEAKQRFGAA